MFSERNIKNHLFIYRLIIKIYITIFARRDFTYGNFKFSLYLNEEAYEFPQIDRFSRIFVKNEPAFCFGTD